MFGDADGKYYVSISEVAIYDLLDEPGTDVVLEFETEPQRHAYLRSRGWA